MDAAKKAKTKQKKSKKGADNDDQVEEEARNSPKNSQIDEEYDLADHESFKNALKNKIQRPFIFGPVEFDGLDQKENDLPFDYMA